MRFMVITKATADSESGRHATTEEISTMGGFIQEMVDAEKKTVVDGPFAETKELVGGFFLVEMKSLEECIEWFKRCPVQRPGGEPTNIEIRQVIQAEDLGEAFTPELREAVAEREAHADPTY